ncbi:hypothetical protein NESM_000274500 [Novymonas esmeraldas]|uniref:Uncharacterized protein n=1 Tax=Novymonas esmeraldas TaxID=1808958 RepID=A0AAW0F7V3_9TRYP
MAKSSRSKWKKMHRRQQAREEATNTVKRLRQLNRKLGLTAKGGISAVPPQEPERRFHFLNPELDPRVPNTRKELNNNYRAELNSVHYDYAKPLVLAQPKTNMYGKSCPDAPHPMTVTYESIDADAPVAGHALTKADMERLARRQQEAAATAAAAAAEDVTAGAEEDDEEDGPEEYVFGITDTAPRRATSRAMGSSGASSTDAAQTRASATSGTKITSMQMMRKKNGAVTSAGGASKMKQVGQTGGAGGTRIVSSGGKAAQKKTGNTTLRRSSKKS